MNFLRRFTFSLLFIFSLMACDSNRWNVELSNQSADLQWQRFELDLFDKAEAGLNEESILELKQKYPQLLPLYSQAIMRFGNWDDPQSLTTFQQFTSDENILELLKEVKKIFPLNSLSNELRELEDGFLRYQYFFPEKSIPKVKSMISAFTYSTVVDDSLLVIGVDNYLGKDFYLYPQAGIPEYKFSHFSREFMVSDAIKAWLLTEFPADAAQNLLEQMIYQGKILYVLSALLPETQEHLWLDYQPEELEWCNENAVEIWAHFLEMELFFTTENHKIRKYMGDAPFIPGFPEGSPGRVGQWLGFEIVKKYMNKNTQVNLPQLMQLNDANKILQESKYKPS